MSQRVGILYDNISKNTGDAAIGISLVKILCEAGARYDVLVPGRFNAVDYDTIVVGGGHILRPRPDPFYDRFRIRGSHILNAAGILGAPRDLRYLEGYRYITVRSNRDKEKLSYLRKKVGVVPCTSMLLEDLEYFPFHIRSPSVGVHLFPGMLGAKEERAFIRWASSLAGTVYFIPITHYNKDYFYMQRLSSGIPGSVMLPPLHPLEIFTLMGRLDRLISSSLHGAIFSYAHNTPFVLLDYDEKMRSFMAERGLEKYLFRGFEGMKGAFERLCEAPPDYGDSISRDRKVLDKHVDRIKGFLPKGRCHEGGGTRCSSSYLRRLPLYAASPGAGLLESAVALPFRLCRSLGRKLEHAPLIRAKKS